MNRKPSHHDIFLNRKEFQLERMILFSDAVFAIAITLLVIEIKVPVINEGTTHGVIEALIEKIPEFFGFFLSFAVIGQFWTNHHRIFGFVTNYTTALLWLNLNMLFWIVLIPFTSSLNSIHGDLNIVWFIYSFNMFMIGISMFFIDLYIGNKKRNISTIANNPHIKKLVYKRSFLGTLFFFIAMILCLFNNAFTTITSRIIYFAIPISMIILNKKSKKVNAAHAITE
ncbi:MAG: DUF1211 domain-containing protein [Bacteroidetes bacterium]|nr:DUF1211 domain-containing protein [Bacteroidota bacterium]MBS1650178.1 DUF1211 domain-containing protein [Bacteroidota bacterium]